MRNKIVIIIFSIFCFSILTNLNTVQAFSYNTEVNYRLDEKSDCEGILGTPTDSTSFAYLLQQIFNVMRYLAPTLCVVLSIMDFLKAAANQDKEGLTKAFAKTGKRLVLTMIIFFIPTLINFIFPLLGWYGTCGIE